VFISNLEKSLGLAQRPRRLAAGSGKTAHDMAESVHLAHGSQGLLVQPLPSAPAGAAGNVGKAISA